MEIEESKGWEMGPYTLYSLWVTKQKNPLRLSHFSEIPILPPGVVPIKLSCKWSKWKTFLMRTEHKESFKHLSCFDLFLTAFHRDYANTEKDYPFHVSSQGEEKSTMAYLKRTKKPPSSSFTDNITSRNILPSQLQPAPRCVLSGQRWLSWTICAWH